jgi:purine-nucleoside phosphorylase
MVRATCQPSALLTVVDSHYIKKEISADERETSLNNMIRVALDSTLSI